MAALTGNFAVWGAKSFPWHTGVGRMDLARAVLQSYSPSKAAQILAMAGFTEP